MKLYSIIIIMLVLIFALIACSSDPGSGKLGQYPPETMVEMDKSIDEKEKSSQKINDPLAAIDEILDKLELGNIVFNSPPIINLNETRTIQLFLGVKATIEELKQMIEAEGNKKGASIKVANRMEARLSGTNFAITAVTPEVQVVSRNDVTEWKWEVKPVREGRHHLHLTLSVLLNVDGETTSKAIRTFDNEIEVEVTLVQQVGSFIENHVEFLWIALVPLFVWISVWIRSIWNNRRKYKLNDSDSNS